MTQRRACISRIAFRSRANLRLQSRSAIGGYPVSVKAEPIEETKESGIILAPTGRGQRLNNCAAILRSEKRWGDGNHPRRREHRGRLLEPMVRVSKPPASP